MAFAKLEDVIPKILKNINFKQYLLDNDYQLLANKNIKGFQCYSKKGNLLLEDDIVFIGHHNNVDIYYSSLFNDFGDIIDFVKNRIELENDYETFAPNKDHFIEAVKKLVYYINEKGENDFKNEIETTSEDLQNLKRNTFTTYYKCVPIFDTKYLEEYKIEKNIITHPIFQNTIYNTRGLLYNDEQLDIINTAFPLFNEGGKECGLYFENLIEKKKAAGANISFFAPGTIETGLWFSNNFLVDKKFKTKVTVVNNPKDALAHFAHLKENRFYVATFKTDQTTYEHLKSVLFRKRSNLYLAGNVSIANFVEEIKIIIEMLDSKITFVKENYDTILIEIDKTEQNHFDKLLKLIRKNNTAKYEQIIKTLGDESKKHLQNDLIMPNQDSEQNIIIKVPKNFKTLYYFEQILIKTFPAPFDIIIEKPMYLDWTQQNIKIRKAVNDTTSSEQMLEKYIEEEKIFVLSN